MLGYLLSIIKDTFEPICCRHCKFQTIFAFRMCRHIPKSHSAKLTKKDFKFLLKYNFITRVIKTVIALPLFAICFILKIILMPLYYFYEIL